MDNPKVTFSSPLPLTRAIIHRVEPLDTVTSRWEEGIPAEQIAMFLDAALDGGASVQLDNGEIRWVPVREIDSIAVERKAP
jgi:hypothetical protein